MTYPSWICSDCGEKYGHRSPGMATWHVNICDVCNRAEMVTEPRDYGHLRDGWEKEPKRPNPTDP